MHDSIFTCLLARYMDKLLIYQMPRYSAMLSRVYLQLLNVFLSTDG